MMEDLLQAYDTPNGTNGSTPLLNAVGDIGSPVGKDAEMSEEEKRELSSRMHFSSRLSHSIGFRGEHPVNSATLTIFLLINAMIGSGILNQPYVFRESGIVGGIVGYFFAIVGCWLGLLCLTFAGIEVDILEYSGLIKSGFGKWGEKVVDLSIIILSIGSEMGYILVIGTTLSDLLGSWGCDLEICNSRWMTILPVAIFVLPVCFYRHLGHMAWLSLFSVLAIIAVLVLVLIGGPIHRSSGNYSGGSGVVMFSIEGTLKSTGSIVFALSCASSNFQAYISTEVRSQTKRAWSFITGVVMVSGAVMCMVMGIVGYVSFGNRTDGMILDNFTAHGFDFFKAMIIAHLVLYIPTDFVILRYSVVKLCMDRRSELLPVATHTGISIVLLTGITSFVLLLMSLGLSSGEAFSIILDVTGGIGGSLVNFILPAAIYIKIMPQRARLRILAWILLFFGFFVMFAVVTVTIISHL